jgi:hypothetical protein
VDTWKTWPLHSLPLSRHDKPLFRIFVKGKYAHGVLKFHSYLRFSSVGSLPSNLHHMDCLRESMGNEIRKTTVSDSTNGRLARLCGHIGVIRMALASGWVSGPYAASFFIKVWCYDVCIVGGLDYKNKNSLTDDDVDPVGVATQSPSVAMEQICKLSSLHASLWDEWKSKQHPDALIPPCMTSSFITS